MFLSASGNQYIMPLDVELKSIRALPEGLLIGWGGVGHSYHYGVIVDHPMGHLSPLGLLSDGSTMSGDKWLDSSE